MALSVGLDTAVKALRAHQLAVDVAAHNIANAHTPGFSRQRVLLRPVGLDGSDHFSRDALLGRAGMGVDASDVHRIRDIFLDYQIRQSFGDHGQYQTRSGALQRAEFVFNDPNDEGLAAIFNSFWNTWQDVVNEPEGSPARTSLVHAATTLTTRINRAYAELDSQRKELDFQLSGMADKINAASAEIAELNLKIKQVELNGDMANDLRDRRDLLMDDLAKLANITYSEQEDGQVNIYLGNHELVVANDFREVELAEHPDHDDMHHLVFKMDGMPLETTTGELRGLYDARDQDLPNVMAKLDELAAQLITSINTIHEDGYGLDNGTGREFFTGTGAADIALNADLAANPDWIATAANPDSPGDNSVALQIANLQLGKTMAGGTQTFDDFYANMVSVLGADVNRASGLARSAEQMNSHLDARRQAVSGVNIDEEVTNLAASQHAYNAAARVITTIDQMLETLINGTGVVGR